jgi:hypothetical protein
LFELCDEWEGFGKHDEVVDEVNVICDGVCFYHIAPVDFDEFGQDETDFALADGGATLAFGEDVNKSQEVVHVALAEVFPELQEEVFIVHHILGLKRAFEEFG